MRMEGAPDRPRCLACAERDQRPCEEHVQPDRPGHRASVYHLPGQQGDQAAAARWAGAGPGGLGRGRGQASSQDWGSLPPPVSPEASAALQVRATKDYCNNYDLTSLNVKAGDIITVRTVWGCWSRAERGLGCCPQHLARTGGAQATHPLDPEGSTPQACSPHLIWPGP